MKLPPVPPQRYARTYDPVYPAFGAYNVPPGFWKRQLPTKVLDLAVRGDTAALRPLLDEHPEYLNKRGPHGRTLLWEAVRKGREAAVKWLVEKGAEIDAAGCYNSESHVQITPYCAAHYYRRPAFAAYLLVKGAELDLFRAAFMGEQGQVERELNAHPKKVNAEDPYDTIYYMPLIAFAVAGGHAALTAFLIDRGADLPQYSALLLGLSARTGRLDLLELLITRGADARAVDCGAYVGADLNIIRYLLEQGAPVNRVSENGFPPLVYLARGDKGERVDEIRLLIDHGADVNAAGPQGRTALHYAAVAGHTRMIALLAGRGAQIALRDHDGATPLDRARLSGKTVAAEQLMALGAA